MKTCTCCGEEKSLNNFVQRKSGPRVGEYLANCKKCQYAKSIAWAKQNPDRVKASNRKSYLNNIDKRLAESEKAKRRVWSLAYSKNNPDKACAQSAKRRSRKLNATPKWANQKYIGIFYTLAQEASSVETKYTVDHMVPLVSKFVSGLHVEFNLQILSYEENSSKNNRFWPDMPDLTDSELLRMADQFYV